MSAKLSQDRIERILMDLRNEPPWRTEAQRECDFYDGLQLHQATLERMNALGIPPIIVNLIKPSIDAVIGMEAKTRADLMVTAENDDGAEVAQGLNVRLKEVARAVQMNRATADAFGYQTKVGIGWVEVARESDPFKQRYRIESIDRNEMWWDWRARKPDLEDARFVVRRKWFDADDLATVFPKHKRVILQSISQRPLWDAPELYDEQLARSWEIEQSTSMQSEEWRDTDRNRLALYEVWYKNWDFAEVMFVPGGRVVEYDKNHPHHVQAREQGLVTVERRRITRVRVAYYLGPHQLADRPSPYPHNRFPYVPFFGYREDRSKAPYGLIRSMKSPQEEVNARRSKMLYNLASRRVIADKDAVDDHTAVAAEVARSDAYIITNPERQRENGFRIDSDAGLNEQQYKLLQESKTNIQEASGIFREMMGRGAGSGQSGEAIKNLIEQSTQALGEIMDNYRDSRRLVGELLLSLILEDIQDIDDLSVPVEKFPGSKERQEIILNHPVEENGIRYRTNDTAKTKLQVSLDEVPATPTYRAQILSQMMNMTAALPPNLQAAIVDMVFMASDLPNRHEIAERLQKVLGVGSDGAPSGGEPTTEQAAAAAQQQQMMELQAQLQQAMGELEMAKTQAQIDEIRAKTEKLLAEAQRMQVLANKAAGSETVLDQAKAAKLITDVELAANGAQIDAAARINQDTGRQITQGPR